MCGIVAAAAGSNIVPVLVEGLKRLEYRGYDSAGLAVISGQGIERVRSVGRVAELEIASSGTQAVTGIAHTRWATHGVPSERNAHPHVSGSIAVVHNGIIENYEILRNELTAQGYVFTSDTDTESIAHLIDFTLRSEPDLFKAVRISCRRLVGAYAIAVIDHRQPGKVVVAREGSPLLLGVSDTGNYAASDASALLQVTRNMVYLENGDIAELTVTGVRISRLDGTPAERPVHVSQLSAAAVELGNYQHYMQKEIFEQPEALANTLEIIGGSKTIQPGIFGAEAASRLADVDSILILACGTSSHSGYTARYWLEAIAGVPCSVEIASEYRYRSSVPNPKQLIVAISQSGETADTMAALRHAKTLGQDKTLAICNVPESAIVRECALRFITRAGPEIGVASTKAFTTQLAALFLLTLVMAKVKQRLTPAQETAFIDQLRHLPVAVNKVLALENDIEAWAKHFADKHHALFLGRGRHYPIALEGALKLKEISYIHAEAYPAGELKHGPLALVDADMPVISVAPNDQLLDKLKSNLKEVQARGGELYVFADADSEIPESEVVHILRLPEHYGELSPILHVVPLQLLSYHVALVKGTDVDKPRNLAKSVTVE
ncbi:MAG: glutamine--fructose-6-phosphate transaminase (isomerizing) [Dechloromonas sp.]|jgi:glucosamine--fructose-6-phosphate aminotransferase (isomerizing)|nr:glutamine--fructose-6-phosphate transaminase (isomerizing) [Dechloromonas sp.]